MTACIVSAATSPTLPRADADQISAQPFAARADHPSAAQNHLNIAAFVSDDEAVVGSRAFDGWRVRYLLPPPPRHLPRIKRSSTSQGATSQAGVIFDDWDLRRPRDHQ
jgi:hypothetical protein